MTLPSRTPASHQKPAPASPQNSQLLLSTPYAFTGTAAATEAPFIDLDRIDIFVLPNQDDAKVRELSQRPVSLEAPKLRFIYPYDEGVFLYSKRDSAFPKVSNIQAYLICMHEEAAT